MATHTTVIPDAELPDELRQLYVAWDKECFTIPNEYTWTKPQWHIFIYDDDTPVSYTGLFLRDCTLDGQPLRLDGLGTVMTPIALRGRGYATTGLERASTYMRQAFDAPFALLVTGHDLIPFYGRHGWRHITDPMHIELPDGSSKIYTGVQMVLSLSGDTWPGGVIDLCGRPW